MNQEVYLICGTLSIMILLFLVVICIISVLVIIYRGKQKIILAQQVHEIAVMDKKFEQKMKIEELLKQKRDDEWIREKDDIKKRLEELWSKRNDVTPLDMKRVTLLHLILSGKNSDITDENLDEEKKKINKTFEMIKNYIKD